MAKFRKGGDAIRSTVTKKSGGYKPILRWTEPGESRFIQFLDPLADVPSVLMHRAIIVDHFEDGNPMRRDFVSRLDPGLDGSQGYDFLAQERDIKPKEVNVFRVVELEPVYGKGSGGRKRIEGVDLMFRQYTDADENEVEVPNIAFIQESPYIFGNYLAEMDNTDPIEEAVWKVTQSGSGKDKKFVFERVPGVEPLDLSDIKEEIETLGDLDSYLEELADEARAEELLEGKPDDWVYNEWAEKGKSRQKEEKPARKSRSRSRAKVEDEPEAEEPETEEPEEDAEPPKRSRASRSRSGGSREFRQLRSKAK